MKKRFLLLATPWLAAFSAITPQGVYEKDHRLDAYQIPNTAIYRLADSSVAMISKDLLEPRGNFYLVDPDNSSNDLNLCPGEAYREQPTLADCSGTLIAEDLVLTAGHCISKKECKDNFFVFGYQMNSSNSQISEFPKEDVYSCRNIVARQNSDTVDFAIVKLDRAVSNHQPATLGRQNISISEPVFTLGYPSGLPLKYADSANVLQQRKGYFVSNLDTFAGSSGSGVYSANTSELIGVLVRGGKDYDYDKKRQCYRVHVCSLDNCEGEEVTNLDYILKALP